VIARDRRYRKQSDLAMKASLPRSGLVIESRQKLIAKSGFPMNWTGEYIIEADGLCHWQESMKISDPELAKVCRENVLAHLFIESWVQLGVKVGVA
jgi:hypothetical protein